LWVGTVRGRGGAGGLLGLGGYEAGRARWHRLGMGKDGS
jgi:hypothetical protein